MEVFGKEMGTFHKFLVYTFDHMKWILYKYIR